MGAAAVASIAFWNHHDHPLHLLELLFASIPVMRVGFGYTVCEHKALMLAAPGYCPHYHYNCIHNEDTPLTLCSCTSTTTSSCSENVRVSTV